MVGPGHSRGPVAHLDGAVRIGRGVRQNDLAVVLEDELSGEGPPARDDGAGHVVPADPGVVCALDAAERQRAALQTVGGRGIVRHGLKLPARRDDRASLPDRARAYRQHEPDEAPVGAVAVRLRAGGSPRQDGERGDDERGNSETGGHGGQNLPAGGCRSKLHRTFSARTVDVPCGVVSRIT